MGMTASPKMDDLLERLDNAVRAADVESARRLMRTALEENCVTPKMDDDEGWALGSGGDADVLSYINKTPLLLSLLYDLNLLPEQHPDHESEPWERIFTITNHWRENELSALESRSEVLGAIQGLMLRCIRTPDSQYAYSRCNVCGHPFWDREEHRGDCPVPRWRESLRDFVTPRAEPGAPYDPAKKVVEGKPTGPWKDEAPGPASAAPQPAPSQTGTPIEQRLDRMQALFNAQVARAETAELALSQAKRDAEQLLRAAQEIRLDFANHAPEEQAKWVHLPEFRAAIDAALAKREGEGKK